jgi:hypothetical protein
MSWTEELNKEENNKEFSLLVHRHFKLATMKILQDMREKYDVPGSDVSFLVCVIFARLLNESCYAVGTQITKNFTIKDIFTETQLCAIMQLLSGVKIKQIDRGAINFDDELDNFKRFVSGRRM